MTLIVSWIGVDQKVNGNPIASLYIGTDSRYSWNRNEHYDFGIKVFGSQEFPEIFGFCGDVTFPTLIFGQLIPLIDLGLLINETDNCEFKNQKIFNYIKSSISEYPTKFLAENFTIVHGTRFNRMFKLYKIEHKSKSGITNKEVDLPIASTKVFSGGSGSTEFENNWTTWSNQSHNNFKTSRAVYHCIGNTLEDIKDKQTGGLPQIIGLYRVRNAQIFGTIKNGKKYIYGKEVSENLNSNKIEWRNENFERVDPRTMELVEGAQRQPS